MMSAGRFVLLAGLTLTMGACAVKAQARTEVEMPLLEPPPPPPRVVASYPAEPEVVAVAPAAEPAPAARPPARTPRPEKPEPPQVQTVPEPVQEPPRVSSLTLTPSPGTETQTATAIRDLMTRAARDLSRVNQASLNADSRTQFETARRFLQQAEDALRANNVASAGKLADKAATMAAVLVR